jgi:hypothetical protein
MTGQIPLNSQKLLIANGTVPLADGNSAVDVDTGPWTIPGVLPGARPIGYYDPIVDEYVLTEPQDSTDFLGTLLQPGLNETTIITTGRTPGNPTGVVDTGTPLEPGALSKNPYGSLVPPQLNANYTSAILSPSQYSVAEAIDEVIKCNCDCWVD